eukprot:7301785-Prymnesium_polylepis.1
MLREAEGYQQDVMPLVPREPGEPMWEAVVTAHEQRLAERAAAEKAALEAEEAAEEAAEAPAAAEAD